MSSRYDYREKFRNFMTRKQMRGRDPNRVQVIQYSSPENGYPTNEDFDFLYTRKHVWVYSRTGKR